MLELDTTIIIRLGFSLFEWSSSNSKCKLKSLGAFIKITMVKCLLNFAKNLIYIKLMADLGKIWVLERKCNDSGTIDYGIMSMYFG